MLSFRSNHLYLECIKAAYDFASGELLNLMKGKVWQGFYFLYFYIGILMDICNTSLILCTLFRIDVSYMILLIVAYYGLMGKLLSLKRYLLPDQVLCLFGC